MMMIPEAWQKQELMDERKRLFYEVQFLPDGAVGRSCIDRYSPTAVISAPCWTGMACGPAAIT